MFGVVAKTVRPNAVLHGNDPLLTPPLSLEHLAGKLSTSVMMIGAGNLGSVMAWTTAER